MFDIEHRSLSEITADNILEIVTGKDFEIGSKIPNEFELAKSLGVGRSTVREAIKLLVSRNILIVKRGSGTFVADKTGITEDPLGLSFVTDKCKLAIDSVNVRLLLEPEMAALAAIYASDKETAEIESQCAAVDALVKEDKISSAADARFHELIALASGNIVMEKLIPIINNSVAMVTDIHKSSALFDTIIYHHDIVRAIKSRDPLSAKYAMTMHLLCCRNKITEAVNDIKDGE